MMKTATYLSGIAGGLFIVFRVIGILFDFPLNNVFLLLGLVLLVLVFLPLILVERYLYNKKIDKIIDSFKETDKNPSHLDKGKFKAKGWGMNHSPFRERKSGLTWGGGNIKGAGASRGTRKSFLK